MKAVVYSCVAGFAIATPSPDVYAKFDEFRTKWGRTYSGLEYARRAEYFEETMRKVWILQQREVGTATYTYLGPFADLSPQERLNKFGALPPKDFFKQIPEAPHLNLTLGSEFDWVSKGAVNPVKDQGQCGSCWAFSTVCNLEGTGFVNGGKLVSLSEQMLVDCSDQGGCGGGWPYEAMSWTSYNGLASESAYPYTARDGNCKSVTTIVRNTGYQKISNTEDQMAQALTQYGPLSICLDANGIEYYGGGVLKNPSCTNRINHAVNLVGYGTAGVSYFKIRNSWGSGWGESGYVRMARGTCACGICNYVVTAVGTSVSGSTLVV